MNTPQLREMMQKMGNRRIPAEGPAFPVLALAKGRTSTYDTHIPVMALRPIRLTSKPGLYRDSNEKFVEHTVDTIEYEVRPGSVFDISIKTKTAEVELAELAPGQLVLLYGFALQNRMDKLQVNWKVVEGPDVMTVKFVAKTARTDPKVQGSPASIEEAMARVGVKVGNIEPVPKGLAMPNAGEEIRDITTYTRTLMPIRYRAGDGWKIGPNSLYPDSERRFVMKPKEKPHATMCSTSAIFQRGNTVVVIVMESFGSNLSFGFPALETTLHYVWERTVGPIISVSPHVLWACIPKLDQTAGRPENMADGMTMWMVGGTPIVSVHTLAHAYGFPVGRDHAEKIFRQNARIGGASADTARCLKSTQNAYLVNAAPSNLEDAFKGEQIGTFWAIPPVPNVNQVSFLEDAMAAARDAIKAGTVTSDEVLAYIGPEMVEPNTPEKVAALRELRIIRGGSGVDLSEMAIYWLGDEPADTLLERLEALEGFPTGERAKRPAEAAPEGEQAAKRPAEAAPEAEPAAKRPAEAEPTPVAE